MLHKNRYTKTTKDMNEWMNEEMTHCQWFFFTGRIKSSCKKIYDKTLWVQYMSNSSYTFYADTHELSRFMRVLCNDMFVQWWHLIMHLSIVCPRMGRGGGRLRATHEKFDIFSFQMSIFPPLGLHFESNSHLWGKLIGTHNSLYCSTERLQKEIVTWWQNNGTHELCVFPQV